MLVALLSAGAVTGGLLYGAGRRGGSGPGGARRLLTVLFLAEAAGMSASAAAPGVLALALVITATGLLTGPRDTLQPALLARHTPDRYRTEVFAWLNTFMWAGYGAGTAAAGIVTRSGAGGSAAFATAAAAAFAGAVLAAVIYRRAPSPAREGLPHTAVP